MSLNLPLKTHCLSGRTCLRTCSSLGYAFLVSHDFEDGHKKHYASRRTIFRSLLFKDSSSRCIARRVVVQFG